MSSPNEKIAEALELLPEDMRDEAADNFLSYAREFQQLRADIQIGLDDIEAGRVIPWDFADFLKRAREASSR
jgi:hypothetical protein